MLQAPLRLLFALRTSTAPAVLAATAVSTVVFAATPFLVSGVASDRGVAVGVVGIISTAQLAGFSLASWGAGRLLRPTRGVFVGALLVGIASNAASGLAPQFWSLVGARSISGVALGLIAWIAWAEAFGNEEKVGDIAVVGPIVGTMASPVVAIVIDRAGPDELFFLLAALHLIPMSLARTIRLAAPERRRAERHRPTKAAFAILVALALTTLGGSAVFVFAAAIGQDEVGLSSLVVSLVFATNALAGVPSARFRGRRRLPGFWLMLIAADAAVLTLVSHPVVFWVALPVWGFAFWMVIPAAFSLLAERSRYPEERAGDAQAVMAVGRVVGPLLGGAVYSGSTPALGVVGGGIMLVGAIVLLYVEWRIHPEVLDELLPRR